MALFHKYDFFLFNKINLMSNNEQSITFPNGLKSLLTDFVVDVLRNRVPSDQLPSYAAEYFSQKQNVSMPDNEQTGTFLSKQNNENVPVNVSEETQRRKSVWGGSPVCEQISFVICFFVSIRTLRIQIEI